MLMAARIITGFSKGGGQNASSTFAGAGRSAAGTAGAAGSGGIFSGFANRYKPNSFVRDAVVDGGSRMGAGGSVGFVGRAFGGIAARNGATLTSDSISSVANKPSKFSGTIAGEIADRSLPNYMPQLANGPTSGMNYSNTQITGGHISTTATGPDGRKSNVELFNSSQYDRPETPHTVVNAADGSQWYQVASGEGMGAFYAPPAFTGDQSEAAQVSEAFPNAPEGTLLRQSGEGTLEASYPDGSNATWYSSAHYQEPDAPHETIQGANGLDWYAMTPHAATPQFDTGAETEAFINPDAGIGTNGNTSGTPIGSNGSETPLDAPASGIPGGPASNASADIPAGGTVGSMTGVPGGGIGEMPPAASHEGGFSGGAVGDVGSTIPSGGTSIPDSSAFSGGQTGAPVTGNIAAYNQALFGQFMPGYDRPVVSIDSSRAEDGILEVRHEDGSGTAFYDRTMYQPPRGDHHVFEDSSGGQWYAIPGTPAVERRPVYQDGKPVYEKDELKTINVETIRYKTTPARYAEPARRPARERKAPKKKT